MALQHQSEVHDGAGSHSNPAAAADESSILLGYSVTEIRIEQKLAEAAGRVSDLLCRPLVSIWGSEITSLP